MTRIPATELPTGAQRRITVDDEPVLLLNHEGSLQAFPSFPSHMDYPLEGGTIEDGLLVCPYHGVGFCLKTGEPDGPPAMNAIRIHKVTVDDNGDLLVTANPNQV